MSAPKLGTVLMVFVLVLFVAQFVPYGLEHTNPPDGALASFDSPATEDLARRACFDCHSNRTRWPWYASIAPISWRVQQHVIEGRKKLNFTAFEQVCRVHCFAEKAIEALAQMIATEATVRRGTLGRCSKGGDQTVGKNTRDFIPAGKIVASFIGNSHALVAKASNPRLTFAVHSLSGVGCESR